MPQQSGEVAQPTQTLAASLDSLLSEFETPASAPQPELDPMVAAANRAVEQAAANQPTAEEPAPAAEAQPAVEGEAPAEPAVEAAPVVPEVPTEALDAEDVEAGLDLTKPRGQQIYAAYKLVKQLAAAPAEGGIGHLPSADNIREYYGGHQAFQEVMADFLDPNPGLMVQKLHDTNPDAFARLVTEAPKFLAKANPGAYEYLATEVARNVVAAVVDHAKTLGTSPDAQKYFFQVARGLHHFLTDGKEELPETVLTQTTDPAEELRRQNDAYRARDERRAQAEFGAATQEFSRALATDTNTVMAQEIAKVLAPAKAKLPEQAYNALMKSVAQEVANGIATDQLAKNAIELERRKAGRIITNRVEWPAHLQNITRRYMQYAQPRIYAASKTALKGFTTSTVAASQAATAKAAQATAAASKPLPSGSPATATSKTAASTPGAPKAVPRSNAEIVLNKLDSILGQTLQ